MTADTVPWVSVIVPTYRRPDLLARCLGALRRQPLAARRYEIIVCDDGPDPASRSAVKAAAQAFAGAPAIHYIEVVGTQGPAAARNRGWRRAAAPVIAFTDDDTVPDAAWLAEGLAALPEGAAAAAGRIIMPLPERPSDIELDAAGLTRAEFVTANCFIRRRVLEEVGGFDERFSIAWREDSDLHFTLLERGYSIVAAPKALVVHPLRELPFCVGARMQKKVMYDVLLYGKHPRLYRERIRRGPPWLYLSISACLALAAALALAGRPAGAAACLLAWALLTTGLFLRRLMHSALTLRNTIELLITSLLNPPLSMFWRLAGVRRFGARLP